ncbi:hypothetical protein T4D_13281 [Trichinella pseudospiralis]|uniref:Uncharacterized protein n=1 Tax=Trichinella pseudospiralis TaxID=6337 RepID=A0A0V1FMF0_TRIPS|nr:hypothetical protein T4D_13281 [Trichinella pseudospiralis]
MENDHQFVKNLPSMKKLFLRKVGITQQDALLMEGRMFEMYQIQESLLPLGMKTLSHSNNGEQWHSSKRSHAYRKPLSATPEKKLDLKQTPIDWRMVFPVSPRSALVSTLWEPAPRRHCGDSGYYRLWTKPVMGRLRTTIVLCCEQVATCRLCFN